MRLEGKVAIVSGAASGMGAATARRFAKEGARVVIADMLEDQGRQVAADITRANGTAEFMRLDVTSEDDWKAVVSATVQKYGKLDVLVNNAGVIEPIARTADSDPAAWARNIQINLVGAYHAVRAALPPMIAAGGGTIINLSSGAAHNPLEGWSAYCSAKAGVAMLTRAIALEHAAQGIRVFGFQPGTTDTDMQVLIRASRMNPVSQIPRQNLIPVAHPAIAIVYLCTPAADDLIGKDFSLRDEAFRSRLDLT